MNFGMIILYYIKYENNAKLCYMDTNSFISLTLKQDISMKILLIMLKKGLIHQIMMSVDH